MKIQRVHKPQCETTKDWATGISMSVFSFVVTTGICTNKNSDSNQGLRNNYMWRWHILGKVGV